MTHVITLTRFYNIVKNDGSGYALGRLSFDGKPLFYNGQRICTLEDSDRNLMRGSLPIEKKYGITAIPAGSYRLDLHTKSPRFGDNSFYRTVCGGCLPRLCDVPLFSGVLIHCGNKPQDSHGCILVGINTKKGMVTQSKDTFKYLYENIFKKYINDDFYINIIRSYR